MPPVGFEPTITAGERPQTYYALDRAATGTGWSYIVRYGIFALRGFTLVLSDDFYVTCTAEFSLGVPAFPVIRSFCIFRMTVGVFCTDHGN